MKISLSTSTAALIRSATRPTLRTNADICPTFTSLCDRLSVTNNHSQYRSPTRSLSSSARMSVKYAPAKRVAGQKQDVWSIVNEAAAASPVQPIVNMGQGFL